MPIYEYRCVTCGQTFDHLHRRLGEDAPNCPECGAEKPKRLLSSFSASVKESSVSCSLGKCPSSGGTPCCQGGSCPHG